MGDWSKAVMRSLGRKPADYVPPPRGKAICEATQSHHPGVLQRWVFAKDGVGHWEEYRGCERCGKPL